MSETTLPFHNKHAQSGRHSALVLVREAFGERKAQQLNTDQPRASSVGKPEVRATFAFRAFPRGHSHPPSRKPLQGWLKFLTDRDCGVSSGFYLCSLRSSSQMSQYHGEVSGNHQLKFNINTQMKNFLQTSCLKLYIHFFQFGKHLQQNPLKIW